MDPPSLYHPCQPDVRHLRMAKFLKPHVFNKKDLSKWSRKPMITASSSHPWRRNQQLTLTDICFALKSLTSKILTLYPWVHSRRLGEGRYLLLSSRCRIPDIQGYIRNVCWCLLNPNRYFLRQSSAVTAVIKFEFNALLQTVVIIFWLLLWFTMKRISGLPTNRHV